MATDKTALKESVVGRSDDGLGRWACKKIDIAADSMTTADTYNLIDIPANAAVVKGYIIVTESFISATTGTLQVKIGNTALTGAIATNDTEWAAGDVIEFSANDLEDTAGSGLYVTSADTLDLVFSKGTASGAAYVCAQIVELPNE